MSTCRLCGTFVRHPVHVISPEALQATELRKRRHRHTCRFDSRLSRPKDVCVPPCKVSESVPQTCRPAVQTESSHSSDVGCAMRMSSKVIHMQTVAGSFDMEPREGLPQDYSRLPPWNPAGRDPAPLIPMSALKATAKGKVAYQVSARPGHT